MSASVPSGTRTLKFLDLLQPYPVFKSLCSHLAIGEIVSLTRTCKSLSHLYRALLTSNHWNVDRDLRCFVKDARRLRSQLGQHNALISGSFVLQFFERATWEKSDLDIFVHHNEASNFEEYLVKEEGYSLVSDQANIDYAMDALFEVHTLLRPAKDELAEKKIQIISYEESPILAVLSSFYTSVMINVISWGNAYAIFPYSTFIRRDGLMFHEQDECFETQLQKYQQRGWAIEESPPVDEKAYRCEFARTRRVGDRFSFIIPFDTIGIEPPRVPDTVLEYASFSLERDISDDYTGPHRISACTRHACVLKYAYTCTPLLSHTIGSKLDKLTLEEIQKIPESSRPQYFDRMTGGDDVMWLYRDQLRDDGIQLRQYDDEIPGWYTEWEKTQPLSIEDRGNVRMKWHDIVSV